MNRRVVIPLILLVVIIVAATLIPTILSSLQASLPPTAVLVPTATAPQFATLNCIIGSEKQPFFNDPDVVKALSDKFQIAVHFTTQGSIAMVSQLSSADLKAQAIDCLSPSNNSASALFEKNHKKADFPGYQTADIFYSPLVMPAVAEARDAENQAGVVQQRDGFYYVVHVDQLGQQISEQALWTSLASASTLSGYVKVGSTDPAASNSGNLLYFLLGNAFAGDPLQAMQMSDLAKVLPILSRVKHSQGLQATRSEDFFNRWISGVAEYQYPLGWVYESQILEYSNSSGSDLQSRLNSEFSVLYPEPDIYSVHQVIALTPAGQRLITALQDPQLQALAWKHGFRSMSSGVTDDPATFPNMKFPARLTSVTSLPDPNVITRVVACLNDDAQCQ